MASNAIFCSTLSNTDVNYSGFPLTIGSVVSFEDGDKINICVEINDLDLPDSTNFVTSAYTDCYECLSQNQGVAEIRDCFSRSVFKVTINGLGFVPTFGSSAFLTILVKGKPVTSCFTFGKNSQLTIDEYNGAIANGSLLEPQGTPIQETDCTSCLNNNLFTYEVNRCIDNISDYINLPFGLDGNLISYTNGVNQYCGTVVGVSEETPGPYTYISNFGIGVECDVCVDVANDKMLIQSCTDSEIQQVVWASALFQNGDVSNLSTNDGCFEVIGVTENPITINEFLNFDPQPGCEPCIECNGINYQYVTCDTINGFDTPNLYVVQYNDPPLGISCTEYSSGSNKIYVGTYQNSTIHVFDPLTNTVSTTIPGNIGSSTNDIEYFNSTTLYTLSTDSSYGPTLGKINKIDSTTDSLTNVYTTSSYNYYMTTDATNNRLFYTSYNSVGGVYQVNSFNTITNTVTDTFSSSSGYYRIKYAPNSNKIYTLSGYYNVKVLNADDLSIASTLTFSNYLSDVEYNPCTEQIYITSNGNSEIYVIDTVSDTVVNTISTPNPTYLIKYNPSDSKMYITSNNAVMVLNSSTNNIDVSQTIGFILGFSGTDFTFYPTDNELYLPYYVTGAESGNGDYLGEVPMTFTTKSGYFKSYQYLPNSSYFYNQYLGTCCEIIGTSSNYYETLYSVETFDDCSSCQTCHGQVWEAYGCGLSTGTTFNVLVKGDLHQNDVVKLMWGSNEWICAQLNTPISTSSNYYENYYNSSRNGLGDSVIYESCANCESTSDIGVTLVGCDTGIEKFVSISVENYLQLNSLEGVSNYVINDSTGCYTVTNFCPIPLSATTEFTPVQFFAYCELCLPEPDLPRSANTETTVCEICCDCGATGSTTNIIIPPHPVWTDGYGRAVTQLNMIVLGGPNGLNA